MGNSQSLDNAASNYILSMNFQNLNKLHDKLYCNKLTGLTSTIIEKYYKTQDIHYLLDRVKYGKQNGAKNELVIDSKQQKEICKQISIFYVKIAHIYSTITMALNPKYVYTDKNGKQMVVDMNNANKIPKGVKSEIKNMGLCNIYLDILNEKELTGEHKPNFCNIPKKNNYLSKVPEFMNLYYDNDYNSKTGKFEGMSTKMKNIFNTDLKIFYYHFTGNLIMPDSIKSFSDIKLSHYDTLNLCKKSNKVENNHYKNKLFAKYAVNLKEMMIFIHNKQKELTSILNNLFIKDSTGTVNINSTITEQNIDDIIANTRNIILELYLKCEDDFIDSIKLYESILESLILFTTKNQIIHLNSILKKDSTS